jgi:hypothetical protein
MKALWLTYIAVSRYSAAMLRPTVTTVPLAAALLAFGGSVREARADTRPVSVGPYAQVGIGGKAMIGKAEKHAAAGTGFVLHAGTDLFKWLSVGGRLDLSNHGATVPAPPEGEYMQFYGLAGEARLSLSTGPVAFYAEGSLGYAAVSTNLLEKVNILEPGQRLSPTFSAGGGLEYQLQNRHYAFGLGGDWLMYQKFDRIQAVSALAHLRYTY